MSQDDVFWLADPNVLLRAELFPSDRMSYNQSLNAISRLVVLVSILFFALTRRARAVAIMALSLFAIAAIHGLHAHEEREAFESARTSARYRPPPLVYSDLFLPPSSNNPFQNFLPTDALDRPDRKPAGPAYNPAVQAEIMEKLKQGISDLHPDDPDYMEKLAGTAADRADFQQSLRPFYTLPCTTGIPDMDAYSKFIYGEPHDKRRY